MTTIQPRSSWGARYADGDLTLTGLATGVFIHHTASAQVRDDVEAERAAMRGLESTGKLRFGTGISYNVLVFPSGRAYQGVSFNRRGAHTDGRNSIVRSICFVGNYEVHQPSDAAMATARAIIAEGRGKWWTRDAPVRGHRDIKATACPGRNVYARLGELAAGPVATPVVSPVAPTAPAPATNPFGRPLLDPDGFLGADTIREWQHQMGTEADGVISTGKRGSSLVHAVQKHLIAAGHSVGRKGADGFGIYPNTVKATPATDTIGALQDYLGTHRDGWLSSPSLAIVALQRRLNAGTF